MTTEQSGGIGDTKSGRSTRKSPTAFRTIGEASEELGVPQHVLRFWETKFSQLKPLKRAGGRRYYRPEDMELLTRIRDLLYQEGFTIKGAKRSLSQKGGAKSPGKTESAESEAVAPAHGAEEQSETPAAAEAEAVVEETASQAAAAEAPTAPVLGATPAPAPLFESLSTVSDGKEEATRLRAALEEIHRDLTLLRQEIAARLS